jgi:hypothetical protein
MEYQSEVFVSDLRSVAFGSPRAKEKRKKKSDIVFPVRKFNVVEPYLG